MDIQKLDEIFKDHPQKVSLRHFLTGGLKMDPPTAATPGDGSNNVLLTIDWANASTTDDSPYSAEFYKDGTCGIFSYGELRALVDASELTPLVAARKGFQEQL